MRVRQKTQGCDIVQVSIELLFPLGKIVHEWNACIRSLQIVLLDAFPTHVLHVVANSHPMKGNVLANEATCVPHLGFFNVNPHPIHHG